MLYAAGKRGLDIGIFCALHTHGRRLNWHPHVHVSVTCGGIDEHGKWKKISFRKDAMRTRWMWNIRQLLLSVWSEGIALPPPVAHHHRITVAQPDTDRRRRLLACVHVKKTAGGKNTVKYRVVT